MRREPTNQELIDRYIFSLETLLPPDKAHDIAAEIRSNLQSLLEDRGVGAGFEPRRGERDSEAAGPPDDRGQPLS